MADTVSQRKARLRREALHRRSELDTVSAAAASERVAAHVTGLQSWLRAEVLHTYVSSLPNEVDTHALIEAARERGVRIVVPVVTGRRQAMRHAEISGLDELARGPWDLWQPRKPRFVEAPAPDLVIVPGVLFDRGGYRVGHGGGYYDRFLGELSEAQTIGLIYDEFFVDRIPTEDHDVPVDVVITPSGVHPTERAPP